MIRTSEIRIAFRIPSEGQRFSGAADEIVSRDKADTQPTVDRVVAVVAEHEIMAGRHYEDAGVVDRPIIAPFENAVRAALIVFR